MEFTTCSFFMYFVAILLMQMPLPISAQFMVQGTVEPLVATLGGQVEIQCHISPKQSAAHMEVRWFRNRYTQPVYLYQDGRDHYGEVLKDYVERTKLLKESIGEGNVTLRIQNVVASDAGEYHCLFKDGDISEEAIVEIKIAAVGLEMQFNINVINGEEIMVECNSGGWFPKPLIQWIDNSGQIIPPSSEFYSQDKSKLFHMNTALILKDSSKRNVTCYLQNPITGQEKWTNIKLADTLSVEDFRLKTGVYMFNIFSVFLCVRFVCFLYYQRRNTGIPYKEFLSMFLLYVVFMGSYAVCLYLENRDPVSRVNIMTNNEKFIIYVVIILFASMHSCVYYTLVRGFFGEDSRHSIAADSTGCANKWWYRWLLLPSHLEIRAFFHYHSGMRSSNQDHEDEATHKITTTSSLDSWTSKKRAATI